MSKYQGPAFGTTDTFTPDNLHAGDFPTVTEDVTVASGQNLVRGAVVGKVEYTGEVKLSLEAADDGSEVPFGILVSAVNASAEAKGGTVYLTGEFNERSLTIGAGHTAASIKDGLRALGIFIKSTVAAGV
jgi:hypothetical protein